MKVRKKLLFIINPFSGGGKSKHIVEKIQATIDHSLFQFTPIFTESAGHASILAANAVQENYDIVVAVGGDGTVNEVASELINTKVTLGIVPTGSGNGLAMHLGIGRNIHNALKIINANHAIVIDTCLVNDRKFINLSGIGFDATIAYKTLSNKKRGLTGYLKQIFKTAWQYDPKQYEFYVDNKKIQKDCLLIEVANAPMFGYNFEVAPFAKLNDGLLEVVIINKAAKWKYLSLIPKMLNASINKSNLVERFSAKEVIFNLEEESALHVDGEGFLMKGEIKYSINPLSLQVIAAEKYSKTYE